MRPVVIIDDENFAPPTKERQITIYKQELFEDMDAESYKFSEVRPDLPSHRSDILASEYPIQEKPYALSKERVVTVNKQLLFEDLDAETIKFAQTHPELASSESVSSKNSSLFNVVQTKDKQITIYKQRLFEDMDAETVKFCEAHPELAAGESNISPTAMIQTAPYVLTKNRQVTLYKQALFEDLDAETRKFFEAHPELAASQSNINASAMIQTTPYVLTKNRQVTLYKQALFEDLDAETRKFSEMRPENPSPNSEINPTVMIQSTPYTLVKERLITIYKQKLYDDIDAESYKYAEARADAHPQQSNATGSDTAERLDGHIIARLAESCDARLRKRLNKFLKNSAVVSSEDNVMEIEASFLYNFVLSTEFNDSQMASLAKHIHHYLVWGVLYDWYGASLGSDQAKWFQNNLAETENAIIKMIACIDGHLAVRHLEFMEARLRKRLVKYLNNTAIIESANNNISLGESFVFNLSLSAEFTDSMMETLKNYMHRYLVWGALFDWYGASIGSEQAKWFQSNLVETENAIVKLIACIDGHLALRHLDFMNAQLRKRLVRYLNNSATVENANDNLLLSESYVFNLSLSTEFPDSMMDALKEHMHRYLVWGALLDWYGASLGSNQAEWFRKTIDDAESKIISLVNRIDGKLAVPHLEFADAKLRKRIVRYLDDSASVVSADNNLDLSSSFVYNLVLPSEFNDSQVDALKDHINRYLIWCALYDWYGASLGVEHSRWFEKQIGEIESAIVMMVARIDGRLAERHLEFGDAKLRKRLLRFLNNTPIIPTAENEVDMESSFVYTLIVSTEFNDSQMGSLASHINRYLVWSALYDWYGASLGSTQSRWFESQIKTIGDNIVTMVARIDGHLAVRHLEFRDAKLRKKLVRFIKNDEEVVTANDTIDLSSTFVYDFELPVIFKDSMLDPLKDYIHRYLVWGGLFDWYGAGLGSDQAEWFRSELKDLEDAIVGMLSLPSIVKRPLQPFGPAKKMY